MTKITNVGDFGQFWPLTDAKTLSKICIDLVDVNTYVPFTILHTRF